MVKNLFLKTATLAVKGTASPTTLNVVVKDTYPPSTNAVVRAIRSERGIGAVFNGLVYDPQRVQELERDVRSEYDEFFRTAGKFLEYPIDMTEPHNTPAMLAGIINYRENAWPSQTIGDVDRPNHITMFIIDRMSAQYVAGCIDRLLRGERG